MLASERQHRILQLINANGSVRAAAIAKTMNVSTETIRKDLVALHKRGLLMKKFGGAVAVNEFGEQPVDARAMENREAKNSLALRALEFIGGNNVVYIDSGSTLLCMAKIFPTNSNLAVVTNSFKAVEYLVKSNNTVFFVGGEVSEATMATSGIWASFSLNTLKIDVAFLGSSGFQSHNGPCSKTFSDIQFKMEVLKNTRQAVVLADSSKFTSNAIAKYADWSDIDTLITTEGAPPELMEAVKAQTRVIVVPSQTVAD